MATTTLLLHSPHHHHHEPHKRQAEDETSSSCDGSDVSSRHPASPLPPPALSSSDSFNHQNNAHVSVTQGDDRRPPSTLNPQCLPGACSDEEDCCSDDEDELLSVGSETPPPIMPITNHLIALSSSNMRLSPERDDEDSDAKTEMCSASQSSDSCRSSISRCSLITDCYSTSSITSPVPPSINAVKLVSSSPEDLCHSHLHSSGLRDNVFSKVTYRPQQISHNSSVSRATRPVNNANNATNNVSMRALKFSIDNILKPDFGRQTASIYNNVNVKKVSTGGGLLPMRSSKGLHDTSTITSSTSKKNSVSSSNNRKHCISVEKVGSKSRSNGCALPMDLSKMVSPVCSSADGRESSSAAREGSVPAVGSQTAAVTGGSSTGSQPASSQLLWPAWVYCTRYSDRPSSGKSKLSS